MSFKPLLDAWHSGFAYEPAVKVDLEGQGSILQRALTLLIPDCIAIGVHRIDIHLLRFAGPSPDLRSPRPPAGMWDQIAGHLVLHA
jgi:hypothetical protein